MPESSTLTTRLPMIKETFLCKEKNLQKHKNGYQIRTLWGDLTEVFKILKSYKNINISQSNICGYLLKLNKKRVRLDVAKFFFSNRVITERNMLSEEIIAGNSLPGFKRKPDRHLRDVRGFI